MLKASLIGHIDLEELWTIQLDIGLNKESPARLVVDMRYQDINRSVRKAL